MRRAVLIRVVLGNQEQATMRHSPGGSNTRPDRARFRGGKRQDRSPLGPVERERTKGVSNETPFATDAPTSDCQEKDGSDCQEKDGEE